MSIQETLEDLQNLVRQLAVSAYARAKEDCVLQEFEHIAECSNHLWDCEGAPILATLFYQLSESSQNHEDIRSFVRDAWILYTDVFESDPEYTDDVTENDFLSKLTVRDGNACVHASLDLDELAIKRAGEEKIFGN